MESNSPVAADGSRPSRGPREDASSHYQDEEVGGSAPPTPPPRSVSYSRSARFKGESPGIKTVGTEDTLTINHVTSNRSAGMLGMSRPVMILVGLFALSTLGAGLWGFLTIPGLYDQIEELELQVN